MTSDLSLRDGELDVPSLGQRHGCEDSRREPWPDIREGLRFPDPTLQSRREGSGQQGTRRHAGSSAETTHVCTRQAFKGLQVVSSPGMAGREASKSTRTGYIPWRLTTLKMTTTSPPLPQQNKQTKIKTSIKCKAYLRKSFCKFLGPSPQYHIYSHRVRL